MSKPDEAERFWSKVEPTGFCWNWTGCRLAVTGHGQFTRSGGVRMPAHRWSYEHMVGPIPDGMVIDHLCRNTGCVNPDHLEPVTNRENILRGYGATAVNARKTVCRQGHSLDNPYLYSNGARECRTCRLLRGRGKSDAQRT